MNREYAFLSYLIPHSLKEDVYTFSKNNMQEAANALGWHIYNGLCQNLNAKIRIFNVLPIGSYPQYYKKPFIKKADFETDYCSDNCSIGFCNIKFIRKYILPFSVFKELDLWCKTSKSPKTLIVYTASFPFMKAVQMIKKHYPDLTVCDIIADLPDMSSLSHKNIIMSALTKKFTASSYKMIDSIDAFVLLTKHMADYMKIKKPYCVMEGISTKKCEYQEAGDKNDGTIKILYSGTLHKCFGVLNLLNAFKLIKDEKYRLTICGIGDGEPEVRTAARDDKRIRYLGQLSREEVLQLQTKSTVLVNPRQNNEEFTKYSFPSKNLEYLSSGVPLVAYKLDGIPDEYDRYIFYVEDNSIEALRDKLVEVCGMSEADRTAYTKEVLHFVEEKNEINQTRKIVDLLKKAEMNNEYYSVIPA